MYSVESVWTVRNREVSMITMSNYGSMQVKLLNYGATIVEIAVPDRYGRVENVVLTYGNINDYLLNPAYYGSTVGRVSGRISGGEFTLEGKKYSLAKNLEPNHIHGGPGGFSYQVWDYQIREENKATVVEFTYNSSHQEEGFPGNLAVTVLYRLTEDNELSIEYRGRTDQKTLCNLTNHTYFNLSGNCRRKVTDQFLQIHAEYFLELNEFLVPTGALIKVENTPMDFNGRKLIGRDIDADNGQLRKANGYDHPWILSRKIGAVEMEDEESGRKMTISTTYPCVVVYSYNFPDTGKLQSGKVPRKYDGICFEAQYEPDGINHNNLNPAILDVDDLYCERTVYRFTVGKPEYQSRRTSNKT